MTATTVRDAVNRLGESAGERVGRTARAYDPEGEVNLSGSLGSLTVFTFFSAGAAAILRRRDGGSGLPDGYSVLDIALGGLATHKFSRLLSKASVTSPLRAPFTTFEEPAGSSEHIERPRGQHGIRHTVGELLTCPFCLGPWIAGAYVLGLATAPRAARTWAATFAVTALSDSLQHVYAGLGDD